MLARWAMNRFFRLIPIWLQVAMVGAIVIAVIWQSLFREPTGGSLVGYNHTDRLVFSYWVNGNWGGNGGTTCCWSFKGDTAEVIWILDVTPEDIEAGLEEERHSVTIPMPKRTQEDQYLHVHFLPGNEIDLVWSPNIRSPKFELYRREFGE